MTIGIEKSQHYGNQLSKTDPNSARPLSSGIGGRNHPEWVADFPGMRN